MIKSYQNYSPFYCNTFYAIVTGNVFDLLHYKSLDDAIVQQGARA